MSKKIIQLSTKQCPPCQRLRGEIEKIIDKTPYIYEYTSLYNGADISDTTFNLEQYWEEVHSNIKKYREQYGLKFFSFPTFIKEEAGEFSLIDQKQIIKFLEDESK